MLYLGTEPLTAPVGTAGPAMKKGKVWTISAAHLMNDLMTTGIVPALLPIYKLAFHLSYAQVGLVVLFSYLTSSVMQPVFGALTDKKPLVWLLPIGLFLSCFGLAMSGIAPSYGWVIVAISLSGLGSGAFHPEASRGAHFAAGDKKGLAQAIFQVGGNSGQAFGPLMIPLFILSTGRIGLLWFLLLAVVGFLMTMRLLPWYRSKVEKERVIRKQITGKNHIPGILLMVVVIVLRSWCQIGVSGFLPFYYVHRHMNLGDAELYNFIFLAAGAVGTFIGGTLSDKLGKKRLLLMSMLMAIPFAFLLPYATGVWAVVDLVLFGFSVLSSFAVTVVYAQLLLPRNLGLASGLTIGFGVGAGGIGATLMGVLSDHYGISFIFFLLGFMPLLGAIFSIFLPNDKKLVRAST